MQAGVQRLIQLQVDLEAEQARSNREMAELRREQIRLGNESREKLAKLEREGQEARAKFMQLIEDTYRLMEGLPEAVREKIGFKPSTQ